MKDNFNTIIKDQFSAIALILFRTLFSLFSVYYIQKLLDSMIDKDYDSTINILKSLVFIIVCYFLLIFLAQYFLRKLFFKGNFTLMKNLYIKYIIREYDSFQEVNSGEILSKITNDSSKVADWYSQGRVIIFTQTIILIATLSFMASYNYIITMIILCITFSCFLIVKIISTKISNIVKEDQSLISNCNKFIIQTFNGFLDLKQLKKEDYFINKFRNIINKRDRVNTKIAKYFSVYVGVSATIAFILPILTILISTYFIMNETLSIGSAVALYTYSRMLDEPINTISNQISVYETAKKIENNFKDIIEITLNKRKPLESFSHLKININYFKHKNFNKKILENIKIIINKNDVTIIKGKSGVGKSTIANLIINGKNNYSNFSGTILWNDNNINNNYDISSKILIVNQSPIIYESSLRENIIMGDTELENYLNEIINITCLNDLVSEKGLEYEILENGDNLSGGQKQRIGLARILIRKPEVLILDEPTSALNNKMSIDIAKNIIKYCQDNNITIIVITHSSIFDDFANKVLELN